MQRRSFLAAGAAWMASAFGPAALAQRVDGQIDVHHHVFPPALRAALDGKIPARFLPGEEDSLREMDASGTSRAFISFPNSDITALDRESLSSLIRSCNDYAVQMVSRHPGRYRLFASLPLPHVDLSLKELDRIGREVPADGILMISNYGTRWLGDPQFAPLMQEINRRKLLIYVHPNAADCCRGLLKGVSDAIVEFQTDTSRTIASWLFTGSAERLRDIRFLFSHSGGTMPALIERFKSASVVMPGLDKTLPQGALWYLQRFFYDTAQTANPSALGALLQVVPDTQVMFGSDFPYRTAAEQVAQLRAMTLEPPTVRRILEDNARRVFLMV